MNLYPAIQASMGSWTYYIIRMTMREAAESVRFASEVWKDRTLDRAIQRTLNEGRVKKEIVQYLSRQEHRFFSSIVVAALEGNPHWIPLEISEVASMQVFSGYEPLNDTFGVLRFDGRQKYYALDGQHRLSAIKNLMDRNSEAWRLAPKGFADEQISVIVVVPAEDEDNEEFLQRYRRLFGNLNRYAKQTDLVTNIIMDEDDVFAILTRRLITDHEFFQARIDREKESFRVKTRPGKNLRPGDSFYTSLATLYEMNILLLRSRERQNDEWSRSSLKMFKRFRPADDEVDSLYEELEDYWNALIEILPALTSDPPTMRQHDVEGSDSGLFWPICQELMAQLARDLLDDGAAQGRTSTRDCLQPMGQLCWELHHVPWRHMVLIRDPIRHTWKMRSEDRKPAIDVTKEILWFQCGIAPLGKDGLRDLRDRWEVLLTAPLDKRKRDAMWGEIMAGNIRS